MTAPEKRARNLIGSLTTAQLLDHMKKILNEADLPWKEGEPEERILA